jgi:hypothetical protein
MMKNYELDIGALKIAHETAFVFGARGFIKSLNDKCVAVRRRDNEARVKCTKNRKLLFDTMHELGPGLRKRNEKGKLDRGVRRGRGEQSELRS